MDLDQPLPGPRRAEAIFRPCRVHPARQKRLCIRYQSRRGCVEHRVKYLDDQMRHWQDISDEILDGVYWLRRKALLS
jgi:hypothetical protein